MNKPTLKSHNTPLIVGYAFVNLLIPFMMLMNILVQGASGISLSIQITLFIISTLWFFSRIVSAVFNGFSVNSIMTSAIFLRFALIYALVVAVGGLNAEIDTLVSLAITNVKTTFAVVTTIALSYFLLGPLNSSYRPQALPNGDGVGMMSNTVMPPLKRTTEDIAKTAIHEAGHLILFSYIENLPQSIWVEVHELSDSQYRGNVSYESVSPQNPDDKFPESLYAWYCLLNLGGICAEKVIYGERSDGAAGFEGDMNLFMQHAQKYLSSGFGESYFPVPEVDTQFQHNRIVLSEFKSHVESLLTDFFKSNVGVLKKISDQLVESKRIDADMINDFLAEVTQTDAINNFLGVERVYLKNILQTPVSQEDK